MRTVSDLSDIQPVSQFEDIPERITGRIAVRGDCWIWTGRTEGRGGSAKVRWDAERRHVSVGRLMYALLVGPISPTVDLIRLCRVPKCVNPDHLITDHPGDAGGKSTRLAYASEAYRLAISELQDRYGAEFVERLKHDIAIRAKHHRN